MNRAARDNSVRPNDKKNKKISDWFDWVSQWMLHFKTMRIAVLFFFLFSILATDAFTPHEALPSHACTAVQNDIDSSSSTTGFTCSVETDEEDSLPESAEFKYFSFASIPYFKVSFRLKDYQSNLFRPPTLV